MHDKKKVLEIGCTTVCMYLILLICTLKNGEDGQFYVVYILAQLKIKMKEKNISSVEKKL